MPSARDCWTAFDFEARSGTEKFFGALHFVTPTTTHDAELAALDRVAFFILAGILRQFDMENMTLILTPHV